MWVGAGVAERLFWVGCSGEILTFINGGSECIWAPRDAGAENLASGEDLARLGTHKLLLGGGARACDVSRSTMASDCLH